MSTRIPRKGKVRTYSEFNRVSLLDSHTDLLRIWYWLRHKDIKGSGWIFYDTYLENVLELGLTKQRIRQLYLKGVNEGWWTPEGSGLYITGLKKLALLINSVEGDLIYIPEESFNSIQTFRAFIYATWFAKESWKTVDVVKGKGLIPSSGKTISRDKIEELIGVSKRTQRRYERIAGIKVKHQYAYTKVTDDNFEKIPHREDFYEGENNGYWIADVDGDGVLELVWQTSNRYTSKLEYQRHRKKVGHDQLGGPNRGDGANRSYQRIFYYDIQKAEEVISRGEVPQDGLYAFQKEKKKGKSRGRYYEFSPGGEKS